MRVTVKINQTRTGGYSLVILNGGTVVSRVVLYANRGDTRRTWIATLRKRLQFKLKLPFKTASQYAKLIWKLWKTTGFRLPFRQEIEIMEVSALCR